MACTSTERSLARPVASQMSFRKALPRSQKASLGQVRQSVSTAQRRSTLWSLSPNATFVASLPPAKHTWRWGKSICLLQTCLCCIVHIEISLSVSASPCYAAGSSSQYMLEKCAASSTWEWKPIWKESQHLPDFVASVPPSNLLCSFTKMQRHDSLLRKVQGTEVCPPYRLTRPAGNIGGGWRLRQAGAWSSLRRTTAPCVRYRRHPRPTLPCIWSAGRTDGGRGPWRRGSPCTLSASCLPQKPWVRHWPS